MTNDAIYPSVRNAIFSAIQQHYGRQDDDTDDQIETTELTNAILEAVRHVRCSASDTRPNPDGFVRGQYNDGGFHHCRCGSVVHWTEDGFVEVHTIPYWTLRVDPE